jgi:hypothetical protein
MRTLDGTRVLSGHSVSKEALFATDEEFIAMRTLDLSCSLSRALTFFYGSFPFAHKTKNKNEYEQSKQIKHDNNNGEDTSSRRRKGFAFPQCGIDGVG